LLPLSSVSARHFFVMSGRFCTTLSARAPVIFFGLSGLSNACNVRARAELFFGRFCTALSARAPEIFIWGLSRQQLLRTQNFIFFSLSGRFNSAGEPAILLFFFLCPVASTLQGSQRFFFFAQPLPINNYCAHIFFGHSHSLVPCAQLFVFVSGRCLLTFSSRTVTFL
jgi:hypothetical protein